MDRLWRQSHYVSYDTPIAHVKKISFNYFKTRVWLDNIKKILSNEKKEMGITAWEFVTDRRSSSLSCSAAFLFSLDTIFEFFLGMFSCSPESIISWFLKGYEHSNQNDQFVWYWHMTALYPLWSKIPKSSLKKIVNLVGNLVEFQSYPFTCLCLYSKKMLPINHSSYLLVE